jgi:hypothetical protein
MPLKLIFTHIPSYLLDILTHILIDLIYTDSDKHCLDYTYYWSLTRIYQKTNMIKKIRYIKGKW